MLTFYKGMGVSVYPVELLLNEKFGCQLLGVKNNHNFAASACLCTKGSTTQIRCITCMARTSITPAQATEQEP